MKILHIVVDPSPDLTFQTALRQKREHEVSFLLLQEGVRASPPAGFPVYAARDDCEARRVKPPGGKLLDWPRIVDLIASHDRVLKW